MAFIGDNVCGLRTSVATCEAVTMYNCSVNSAGTSCDVDGGAYGLINLATVGADASYVEYNSTLNDVCRTYEYKYSCDAVSDCV